MLRFVRFNHLQKLISYHNGTFHGQFRTISSEMESKDGSKDENGIKKVIFERNFYVNPSHDNLFSVKTRFMNVHLKSTELESNLFRISVCIGDLEGEVMKISDLSQVGVKCHVDSEGKNVIVTETGVESDPSSTLKDRFVLKLQVPIDSNLEIESDDVTLAPMQLRKVKCHLRNGDFRLKNLKCVDLDVTSISGSVLFEGYVLGNVRIGVKGEGIVDAGLLQGTVVKIQTENGFVRVRALYCDESEIRSNKGTVRIENLTGRRNTVFVLDADANIVCLDGNIDLCVDTGNANVYVSRMQLNEESTICSKEGNVNVSFSDTVESCVRFEGRQLKIQDGIEGKTVTNPSKYCTVFQGMLSKSEIISGPMITASAPNGTVTAKIVDWFHRITMGPE